MSARRLFARALLGLAAVSSAPAEEAVEIGGIRWQTNLTEARRQARLEGKWLWVHFGENPG